MYRSGIEADRLSDEELASLGDVAESAPTRMFRGLRFPARIEAAFERETGGARARFLFAAGMVALLVYNVFLITDQMMIADVFGTALFVRLALFTPIAIMILLIVRGQPSPFLRESLEAALTVLASVSVMYLYVISDSPKANYYQPGLALVLIYGNVVVRLRFFFAVVASLLTILAYVALVVIFGTLPHDVCTVYVTYLVATAVFTLIANYAIERDQRLEYLVSLRERCRHVALAAVNFRLNELSHRDPLTGISNRRALDEYLQKIARRARREAVAIVMIDIDHFKLFNDRYGHQLGDECLKNVAHAIRDSLNRSGDMVARIGGEEFVVVLPGADVSAAATKADAIRQCVADLGILHEMSPVFRRVTISAGVAVMRPSTTVDANTILRVADTALYRAKSSGRNRVEVELP
ncbi:MAG TPA: GGDEF domain-containing protein [Burkholderiales bacterium]|nr:GGDEF domain-containing protein [Burkholderiales bacterium]